MNDGEEQKKVSIRFFTFLHGVRAFEKLNIEEEQNALGECFRYLLRRVGEMAGLRPKMIPDSIWGIHQAKLKQIEQINEKAKNVILDYVNGVVDKTKSEVDLELEDLYYEKCLIMIDIRSLYTKHAYIQDIYLGRKTDYMIDFDYCGFIRAVKYYKRAMDSHSRTSKDRPGLTEYEAGYSPSINELNEKKRLGLPQKYTISEAREVAKRFLAEKEKQYKNAVNHANNIMGKDWTDNFLENFEIEMVKNEDSNFTDLKKEYNCLIKTRGKWTDSDKEYFYLILQKIFEYDSDVVKYLPSNLKEKFKLNFI